MAQQESREVRGGSLFREWPLCLHFLKKSGTGDTENSEYQPTLFNIRYHKAKYTHQPAFFIFSRAALLTDRPLMTAAGHRARQQQCRLFPAEHRLKENASGENGIYSYFLSLLSLWYGRQPLENVIIPQHGETEKLQKLWMRVLRIKLIGLIRERGLRLNENRSVKIGK